MGYDKAHRVCGVMGHWKWGNIQVANSEGAVRQKNAPLGMDFRAFEAICRERVRKDRDTKSGTDFWKAFGVVSMFMGDQDTRKLLE
jgi:hypothetical protein